MTVQELKKYRRKNGLCTYCGKEKDNPERVLCQECREVIYSARRKPKKDSACKPAAALSISDVCRLAAERKISYGKMVQIIESGANY